MEVQGARISYCHASGTGNWWAIYTLHQHEKRAAEMLAAKGCEVFLPVFEVTHRWKDRNIKLSIPLFPCYLFVRENLAQRLQIVTTPGVHMILRHGERFAVVRNAEIEALQKAVRNSRRLEPHPFLQCGERVRVTRGTLEGVEGILVRKKNLCRLILSVEMLARSASVEVDAEDVTPVLSTSRNLDRQSKLDSYVLASLEQRA